MDQLDKQEFDLDDILREFGGQKTNVPASPEHPDSGDDLRDTIRLDQIQEAVASAPTTADTMEFDAVAEEPTEHLDETRPVPDAEPFSAEWEPDYETSAEAFTPSQPIAFENKSRLRQLRHKIVSGPEQRYYALVEKGTAKLILSLLLNVLLLLIITGTTVMHALNLVSPERLRLLVFAQFLGLLLSGLTGCSRLIDGFMDLAKPRFTPNTMLLVTFIVCCVDGVLCLQELRISVAAVFILEMTMAIWAEHHRRSTQLKQMDTMRRASDLYAVVRVPDYQDGVAGYRTGTGEVEHFMDNCDLPTGPEKALDWYALCVFGVSLGLGILAGVRHGFSTAVQICAAATVMGMPATVFISNTRPLALLQKRLHKLGTVLCGWEGIRAVDRRGIYPLEDQDLFPAGSVKLNGMKFINGGDPDEVVAYTTALVKAGGGSMVGLFTQLLDSRDGYRFTVEDFQRHSGGVSGRFGDVCVQVGSARFMHSLGMDVGKNAKLSQAVYTAVDGQLVGVFALHYQKAKATTQGLRTLCSYRGLIPAVMAEDFLLTEEFLSSRFGVNTKHVRFMKREEYLPLLQRGADQDDPVVALTTRDNLAAKAFAVTGARVLKSALRSGLTVHMIGGILGLLIIGALAYVGIAGILTPTNVLLYELLWMIPGLLITEWTRSV